MESNTDSPQSSDQEEHVQDTTYTRLRPAPIGHLRLAEVSEFHDMTICNMQVLLPDAAAAAHAAQALGLVPKRDCSLTPPCPKCGESTRPRTDTKNKFGYRFACSNVRIKHIRHNSKRAKTTRVQTCTGSVSPAHNTFFGQIRAPTLQVLQLMYCWVANFPVRQAEAETKVSTKTADDFYDFCREVAEIVVSNMSIKIGGPGLHVEVDETYTRNRKNQREQCTAGYPTANFGAYCHETGEGLFWHVPNKSRRVLWAYMKNNIESGSIIVSDAAPQYSGCEALGFSEHKIINHSTRGSGRSVNSADPQTYTQNIKIRNVKTAIKSLRTDRTLQQYMCEYTYRNRVLSVHRKAWERFFRFIDDVATVYPGPGRESLQLLEISIPDDVAPEERSFKSKSVKKTRRVKRQ